MPCLRVSRFWSTYMSQEATCDWRGCHRYYCKMWRKKCHILVSVTPLRSQVATCDMSLNMWQFYTVIYWRGYFTVDDDMMMMLMLIKKFLESCHFWPVHVSFVSKLADHQYKHTHIIWPPRNQKTVISQPPTITPFPQKKTLVSCFIIIISGALFDRCSQWQSVAVCAGAKADVYFTFGALLYLFSLFCDLK